MIDVNGLVLGMGAVGAVCRAVLPVRYAADTIGLRLA